MSDIDWLDLFNFSKNNNSFYDLDKQAWSNLALGIGMGELILAPIAGNYIGGKFQNKGADALLNIGSMVGGVVSMANPLAGGAIALGSQVLGGLGKRMFGVNKNEGNRQLIKDTINRLNSYNPQVKSLDSYMDAYLNAPTAFQYGKSFTGKDAWFRHENTKFYNKSVKDMADASGRMVRNLGNTMSNILKNQGYKAIANPYAYGGFFPITGALDYEMATNLANYKLLEAQGKGQNLFLDGGYKPDLHNVGGSWTNGLMYIGAGGTHELNPMGGTQVGSDNNGTPNLLEEGEIVWNNYVFSNRIEVPSEVKQALGIRGKKSMTFAQAADKLQKESAERPNDPISKNGLDAVMSLLALALEEIRQQQEYELVAQQLAQQLLALLLGYLDYDQQAQDLAMAEEAMAQLAAAQQQGIPQGMIGAYGGNLFSLGGPDGLPTYRQYYLMKHPDTTGNILLYSDDVRGEDYWKYPYNYNLEKPIGTPIVTEPIVSSTPAVVSNTPTVVSNNNTPVKLTTAPDNSNSKKDVPRYKEEKYDNNVTLRRINRDYYGHPYIGSTSSVNSNYPLGLLAPPSEKLLDENEPVNKTKLRWFPLFSESNLAKLRYAPLISGAVNVASDLMNLTNVPDYSSANYLARFMDNSRGIVSNTPFGYYMPYNPIDKWALLNPLRQDFGAGLRAILNNSNGNRGLATASAIAAMNSAQQNAGKALMLMDTENNERLLKSKQVNNSVASENARNALQASMANAEREKLMYQVALNVAALRQAAKDKASQARSLNLTNFINSLQNLGIDIWNRNDRNMLLKAGIAGTLSQKPQGMSKKEWEEYKQAVARFGDLYALSNNLYPYSQIDNNVQKSKKSK